MPEAGGIAPRLRVRFAHQSSLADRETIDRAHAQSDRSRNLERWMIDCTPTSELNLDSSWMLDVAKSGPVTVVGRRPGIHISPRHRSAWPPLRDLCAWPRCNPTLRTSEKSALTFVAKHVERTRATFTL